MAAPPSRSSSHQRALVPAGHPSLLSATPVQTIAHRTPSGSAALDRRTSELAPPMQVALQNATFGPRTNDLSHVIQGIPEVLNANRIYRYAQRRGAGTLPYSRDVFIDDEDKQQFVPVLAGTSSAQRPAIETGRSSSSGSGSQARQQIAIVAQAALVAGTNIHRRAMSDYKPPSQGSSVSSVSNSSAYERQAGRRPIDSNHGRGHRREIERRRHSASDLADLEPHRQDPFDDRTLIEAPSDPTQTAYMISYPPRMMQTDGRKSSESHSRGTGSGSRTSWRRREGAHPRVSELSDAHSSSRDGSPARQSIVSTPSVSEGHASSHRLSFHRLRNRVIVRAGRSRQQLRDARLQSAPPRRT